MSSPAEGVLPPPHHAGQTPAGHQGQELLDDLGPIESDASTFSGVTCFSGMSCLAVGGRGGERGEVTLAARWNGKSWSALHTSNVPRPALHSTLGAISCASPTACMAVGDSDRGVGKTGYATHDRALAEWWNGTKWRMLPAPSGR